MKILNENCMFQCITGNPSILITASEQGNAKAKDRRKKILTDKAKCQVKTPLPCTILTVAAGGTPVNCQLAQLSWNNANGKMKCQGNSVLTDISYVQCAHGGVIKPIISSAKTSIGGVSTPITDIDKGNEILAQNSVNGAIGVNSGDEVWGSAKQIEDSEGEVEEKKQEQLESSYASHTLCDYVNCSERNSCEYFLSQVYVENSSAKLSSNFQNNRVSEWNEYQNKHKAKNAEYEKGGWRIAAHHMISGNQVLMMKDEAGNLLYGEIVKLANYFGYDVNNEWNCIMLPTNESNFGQLEPVTKMASAYDVMWIMGRQWHVGGHQYSLDKETLHHLSEYYKKYPEQYPTPGNPDFFSNYRNAMKEEMDKLMLKYSRTQCWKKGFARKKQTFFNEMNSLSKRIEQYLLAFEKNPRMSFPFFVSKVSVEYAYDLPATSKLVVLYKKGIHIRAKRIRLERYMKNELRIIPIEKEDIEIKDNKEFIIFCENVMHFLVEDSISDFTFPFKDCAESNPVIRIVNYGDEGIMQYLMEHSSELIAFANQKGFTYQPIAKIIQLRGGG